MRFGSAWASALQADIDPERLRGDLRQAATAAPEAIRPDFQVVVDAQLPFVELIARAKASGNYADIAKDPAFQSAIEQLANPAVASATARVNSWLATHCAAG